MSVNSKVSRRHRTSQPSLLQTALSGAMAVSVTMVLSGATAVSAASDASQYTLFNPTPVAQMRDMSADRPDTTESPITVDAGHIQIEASMIDYSYDKADGEKTSALTFMDTNIKVGLTHNTDLQFVFSPYATERVKGRGERSEESNGASDLTLRLKRNFWGNDEGSSAFGIMPFVKVATGTELSNDETEGGLILMYGTDLADERSLGLMSEFDAVYNELDDDYDMEWVHTAVLGVDLGSNWAAYCEYVGILPDNADLDYQAIGSFGITYGLDENTQLDIGGQIGLNDAASDAGLFVGFTWRQ